MRNCPENVRQQIQLQKRTEIKDFSFVTTICSSKQFFRSFKIPCMAKVDFPGKYTETIGSKAWTEIWGKETLGGRIQDRKKLEVWSNYWSNLEMNIDRKRGNLLRISWLIFFRQHCEMKAERNRNSRSTASIRTECRRWCYQGSEREISRQNWVN